MHVLICDDDAAFGARMADYIHDYFEARSVQLQTVVCTGAAEALRTPYLELYQLAFLDVDMPGTNGIALGRELKQRSPDIRLVYVSAYLEFAPEGYTVNAYRYLLKRDIARMLPKCLDDLLAAFTDQHRTLTVHHNRATSEIPLYQIYYLESALRQIDIYGDIPHRPICTFYGKLAELPAMLYENGFLQVSRSDVVNMSHVHSIRNYKEDLRAGNGSLRWGERGSPSPVKELCCKMEHVGCSACKQLTRSPLLLLRVQGDPVECIWRDFQRRFFGDCCS